MTEPAPPADALVKKIARALFAATVDDADHIRGFLPYEDQAAYLRRHYETMASAALAVMLPWAQSVCLARCAEIRSRIDMGDSDATAARFEMRALVAWQLAEDFKPKGGV